jgi:PAS domain S-box-containing protein
MTYQETSYFFDQERSRAWETVEPGTTRRTVQLRWLVAVLIGSFLSIGIDYLAGYSFDWSLALRLCLIVPLALLGICVNRWSTNYHLAALTTAAPIFSFGLALLVISLVRPEPGASRFVMADIFVIFAAATAAPLSWRHTIALAVVSMIALAVVLLGFCKTTFCWMNIDLIGTALVAAVGGLAIRWKTEIQTRQIRRLRRLDEEHIATSESMLRLSQEAGHIGSYEWHLPDGPNYWSDEMCRLHGVEPSRGQSVPLDVWRNAIHPDDLATLEERIIELLRSGNYSEIEYRVQGRDGIRWLHGRGHVVREDGGPKKLIGINIDVTERRAVEDYRRDQTRLLEDRVAQEVAARELAENRLAHAEKLRLIGELAGGVAHDFNNLLTVITGTTETLAEGVADRPELATIAQLIATAAERGAKLTGSLLAFARRQPLRPRPTHIDALIKSTCELLGSTIGRQIEVRSVCAGPAGSAFVDPDQLTSAIVNLGLNARDAMPMGGVITIESDAVVLANDDPARELAAGRYVTILVHDTGTGIDPSIRDKLYEPFFTTKEVGEGTGLGLSAVYGFVKQSGGHVEFETTEGAGTTFKILLPACEVSAVEPVVAGQDHADFPRGTESILCVEDDVIVRDFVIQQLQRLGYKTISARNGLEAINTIRSGAAIDLVFTDIVMPGSVDGWQLAMQVKASHPHLKVLFTTGFSVENARNLVADRKVVLLEKPYRMMELARAIRKALDGRTAH